MGQRGSVTGEPQLPLAGAGRGAVCCPQEAGAVSPLCRYLCLLCSEFPMCRAALALCDRAGASKRESTPFPNLRSLCVRGPHCTLVLGWTLRLSPCPAASGGCTGSLLLLGHPSSRALPCILSLVPRDESLGCKTSSAPLCWLVFPMNCLECGDALQEGSAQPRGLPLEKVHLPMIHLPSCGPVSGACVLDGLGLWFSPCVFSAAAEGPFPWRAWEDVYSRRWVDEWPRDPALGPTSRAVTFPTQQPALGGNGRTRVCFGTQGSLGCLWHMGR